jgi:dihydrofolate reductase
MMSISVDGFMAGVDGDIGWHRVDDELHWHFNEYLSTVRAFLSGRVTHELMAGFWPTADTRPESTPPMIAYAAIWREKPKIVYSTTLQRTDWNTTILRGVDPEQVRRLTAEPGGDLALGGADLAACFRRHGLVDEYRLYVHPVVVGQGKRLFAESESRVDLRLLETHTFGNGVVMLRYGRADADGGLGDSVDPVAAG